MCVFVLPMCQWVRDEREAACIVMGLSRTRRGQMAFYYYYYLNRLLLAVVNINRQVKILVGGGIYYSRIHIILLLGVRS